MHPVVTGPASHLAVGQGDGHLRAGEGGSLDHLARYDPAHDPLEQLRVRNRAVQFPPATVRSRVDAEVAGALHPVDGQAARVRGGDTDCRHAAVGQGLAFHRGQTVQPFPKVSFKGCQAPRHLVVRPGEGVAEHASILTMLGGSCRSPGEGGLTRRCAIASRVGRRSCFPRCWSRIWSHKPASTGRHQVDGRGRSGCLLHHGQHLLGLFGTGQHGVWATRSITLGSWMPAIATSLSMGRSSVATRHRMDVSTSAHDEYAVPADLTLRGWTRQSQTESRH
jgi:hypothetical protein